MDGQMDDRIQIRRNIYSVFSLHKISKRLNLHFLLVPCLLCFPLTRALPLLLASSARQGRLIVELVNRPSSATVHLNTRYRNHSPSWYAFPFHHRSEDGYVEHQIWLFIYRSDCVGKEFSSSYRSLCGLY